MSISMRSILTVGIATIAASAVVIAPSVQPPPRPTPMVQLAASTQLLQHQQAQINPLGAVAGQVERSAIQPSLGSAFPQPPVVTVPVPASIGSSIMAVYGAVEPWVQWGFELGAYAVSWIPWVGWLSPQVMIFYYLGERITYSIAINVSNWLDGQISFAQGAVTVGVDTINSFIYFANDQIAFWLPPLPPLPPICLFCNNLAAAAPLGAVNALTTPTAQVGPIGNSIIAASQVLADASLAIWNVWDPIRDGIDYGVNVISAGLNTVSWIPFVPLANFELNETWNLLETEGNQIDWFAEDMINAGSDFVFNAFNGGPLYAVNEAADATFSSVVNRGGAALYAAGQFIQNQIAYFTPVGLAQQRVSTGPSTSVPTALTDALRPLAAARGALKTELDAAAAKASAAVDGVVGDVPGLAAANGLGKKTRDTLAVDLTPNITTGADVTAADTAGTDGKTPGKAIREAVNDAVAGAKARADDNAKDVSEAQSKVAKRLDKSVKKLVTGLQKAGKSVEKSLTRKTAKKAEKAAADRR